MHLVFLGPTNIFNEVIKQIDFAKIFLCEETSSCSDYLNELDHEDTVFIFAEYGSNKKVIDKYLLTLRSEFPSLKAILVFNDLKLKELKKHQSGKYAADGYLKLPLNIDLIKGVLEDYQLGSFMRDHDLLEEGATLPPIPDIMESTGIHSHFSNSEYKMDTQVRNILNEHGPLDEVQFSDNDENKRLNAAFNSVFKDGAEFNIIEEEVGAEEVLENETAKTYGKEISLTNIGIDSLEDIEDDNLKFEFNTIDNDDENHLNNNDIILNSENTEIEEPDVSLESQDDGVIMANDENEFEDELVLPNEEDLEFPDVELNTSESENQEELGAEDLVIEEDEEIGLDAPIEFGHDDVDTEETQENTAVELSLDDENLGDEGDFELSDDEVVLESDEGTGGIELGGELDDDFELAVGDDEVEDHQEISDDDKAITLSGIETKIEEDLVIPLEEDEESFEIDDELDHDLEEEFQPLSVSTPLIESVDVETETQTGLNFDTSVEQEQTSTTASNLKQDDEPLPSIPQESEVVEESKNEGELNFQNMVNQSSIEETSSSLNTTELARMQGLIRQLREEREELLKENHKLETENRLLESDNLALRAELEEVKIEISIVRKRSQDEVDELRYRTRLNDEKKILLQEKNKRLEKELNKMEQKIHLDFSHIKQREKELESKLELALIDADSQVKARDQKIIELKRKIDQLEFNMENVAIKEQQSRNEKNKLEDRFHHIMKTLRGSIELLEEDLQFENEKESERGES